MNATHTRAERVLILGGGLGGVACAQKLGDGGIDVVLLSWPGARCGSAAVAAGRVVAVIAEMIADSPSSADSSSPAWSPAATARPQPAAARGHGPGGCGSCTARPGRVGATAGMDGAR
jgi:hypothetical protein